MAIDRGASGLAARYASALFELADDRKALDETARDLTVLRDLVQSNVELQRVVRSPVIGRAEQGAAIQAVMEAAGISELVRNFVGVVADNRRLFAITTMADAFLAELARRRGEMTADVWSAEPLTQTQLNAVTDALKRSMGQKVTVRAAVDPSLIGGIVVKVGSRLVDASVKSKLNRLQSALKAPVLGG
ncbi:MAG TPA: F0F1 ATP synthase subunit delta [Azospirillaceae bacterium]|nr:F0F1 ATP synthase subunit delta [Azospirillaceae bacterium]